MAARRVGGAIGFAGVFSATIGVSVLGAAASEMWTSGRALTIAGEIHPGDEYKFEEALRGAPEIAIVHLNSPGGYIYSAGQIARRIRSLGFATIVDAARDTCASSCTILFVAGKERIYRHPLRVGGLSSTYHFRGLGFHQGSSRGGAEGIKYDASASADMASLYYELGAPYAASLIDKSPPWAIYGLSGAEAMAQGIATRP